MPYDKDIKEMVDDPFIIQKQLIDAVCFSSVLVAPPAVEKTLPENTYLPQIPLLHIMLIEIIHI
jgi:hypothetical protein